jgi:hypothetical protein
MSLVADALQPRLVGALLSLSGRAEACHLADVVTGTGGGFDLDFDTAARTIRLDFRDPVYLGQKIAGDASRFASAAFMSMYQMEATVEDATTVAWSLVRLYYAAFYSGHALLRLLGESCSYLDSRHIKKIKELGIAMSNPVPFDVGAGAYHLKINRPQTGLDLNKTGSQGGGSHEVFWDIFDEFIKSASAAAMLGHLTPDEGKRVFSKLEAFRDITKRAAGASWLSAVRNEIQYRHDRGVWTPAGVNRSGRAVLARLARQWTRDPMDIDLEIPPGGELGRFVAACAFLVAFCRVILGRISERSAAGTRSFARVPLQLC